VNESNHLVLFDGVCNLCNASVKFLIKRDKHSKFEFIPLQSEKGKATLSRFTLPETQLNSIVFISGTVCYTKSTAVLEILYVLGGMWKLLYGFIIVPGPVRDFVYGIISKSRYKVFGKQDSCEIHATGNP
jgi:predicted DCC family thiol-disulfide oxidoreductase YuxK